VSTAKQFVTDAQELMRLAAVRQYELAERLGITPKHMNQLFKGKVRMTIDQADAIAAALGYRLTLGFTFAAEQDGDGR
jgi:plasmid maintenance system antidote protein VapI